VSKPLRDPGTIKRLQSAATNVVQTAACRPQNHLCLGTFQEASLNIIGNARLVSLVGPVVFIRCWFKKGERKSVRDALRPSTAMGLGVAARSFRQLREDRRRAGGRRQRENGRDRNNIRPHGMTRSVVTSCEGDVR
jgi:hypothetical protein